MSTQKSGTPNNIVPPAAVNIASSTNTNPIVITTSGAHGLPTLDQAYADISGHAVNTNANGVWPATVLSPTTFSIPKAGNGVGAATGTVQSLQLGASSAIPSDGDAENAASVDVALGTLFDQTAFLAQATGQYKLVSTTVLQVNDANAAGTTAWGSGNVVGAQAWTTTGVINPANTPTVIGGDLVRVRLTSTAQTFSDGVGGHSVQYSLGFNVTAPGAGVGSAAKITGSGQTVYVDVSKITYAPLDLTGVIQVGPSVAGTLRIYGAVSGFVNGTVLAEWIGDYTLTIQVWRQTGMLQ